MSKASSQAKFFGNIAVIHNPAEIHIIKWNIKTFVVFAAVAGRYGSSAWWTKIRTIGDSYRKFCMTGDYTSEF